MHTPDEARKLWCPWARVTARTGDASYNRISAPEIALTDMVPASRCLADGCSQWRWEYNLSLDDIERGDTRIPGKGRGFCGLGGRP